MWLLTRFNDISECSLSRQQPQYGDKRICGESMCSPLEKCLCMLRQDTLVPVTAARWLAESLEDSSLVVCPDATHQMYIMQEPLARVCGQLAAAAVPSPVSSG